MRTFRVFAVLAVVLALLGISFEARAGDYPKTFTMKLYKTSSYTYSETGGVTTAPSGVSDLTWTAGGQYGNNQDFRTIDIRDKMPEVKRIVLSFGSSEDTNWSGVTLARSGSWAEAAFPGVAGQTSFQLNVLFSPVDSSTYWAGASKYVINWTAGTSRIPKVLTVQSSDTSDTVGLIRIMRYMRLQFVSGVSAMRNVYVTMTAHDR